MRSRPHPSAPLATAVSASARAPALAKISMRTPSAVKQGAWAAARAAARLAARDPTFERASATCAWSGPGISTPASASSITLAPSATWSARGPAATTAGRPMAAARMATCEVGPPRTVQIPPACRRPSICEGIRSSARTMAPAGRGGEGGAEPPRAISTCRSRSARSPARSARRGSSRLRSSSAWAPSVARHAAPALWPASMAAREPSLNSGSSSSSRWADRISRAAPRAADA